MCRKYSPITTALARWLYPLIDRFDFGIKSKDGGSPRFAYATDQLNIARSSGCFFGLPKITKTHLEEHLGCCGAVYYYTSGRASERHLVCVDFDAHNGERDAWDAAQWVVDCFFPGAYWEPSTNHLGAHLYLVVDVGRWRRTQFNEIISHAQNSLGRYLAATVRDEGFEANVCGIYGLCGEVRDSIISKRGSLAKIPRPKNFNAMKRLAESPMFGIEHFKDVVKEARTRGIRLEQADESQTGTVAAELTKQDITVNRLSPRPSNSFANELMKSDNAWSRSIGATIYLTQHLGRMPDAKEVSTFYDSRDLGTEEAHRDRHRRHGRAIASLSKTFDPGRVTAFSYKPGQYLNLLETLLTTDDLRSAAKDAGYSRLVTYEDLDVALGFHVKQILNVPDDPRQLFTVPVKGLVMWFRALKSSRQSSRSCNYDKARAVRIALVKAGMITLLDDHYQRACFAPDGLGVAKKWGLGESCPQFSEYRQLIPHSRQMADVAA